MASLLGVSDETVRRRITRGELRAELVDGRYRVRRADLERFIRASRIRPVHD